MEEIKFDLRRADNTTVSNQAIVDWNNFYRDICALHFVKHPQTIGGPGVIVEVVF